MTTGTPLDEWSGILPRAGIVRNGVLCPQQDSDFRISGSEYFLLPTPSANRGAGFGGSNNSRKGEGLIGRKFYLISEIEWMQGLPEGWSEIAPNESKVSATLSLCRSGSTSAS